jgi:Tfp pilus assembly protein PilV
MSASKKKIKGITLIEMLVYLAIFGMIFLTIIQFVLMIVSSNQRAEQRKEMERTTTFLLEHMNDSFSRSNTVDIGGSVFNSNNGRIRTTNGVVFYEYSLNNSRIQINSSGTTNFLTTADTAVTKFFVERVNSPQTGLPDGVRITLDIESNKDKNVKKTISTAFTVK